MSIVFPFRLASVVVGLALILTGCASDTRRADAIAAIGNRAIIPNLDAAVTDLENLDRALTRFCDDQRPTTLIEAREAWLEAEQSWEAAELNTRFDSGRDAGTVASVDHSPNREAIDALLQSEQIIDTNSVRDEAEAGQRGLGAIEYLLFGRETASDRSCQLMEASSILALTASRELRDDWTSTYDGLAPFVDQLTSEMTEAEALGHIVDAIASTLDHQATAVSTARTGPPSDAIDPSLEEGEAGAGAVTYAAQLRGIEAWLKAGDESSLIELIRAMSADLARDIEFELARALSTLNREDRPLAEVVLAESDLDSWHDSVTRLSTLFGVDVASVLDLNVGS